MMETVVFRVSVVQITPALPEKSIFFVVMERRKMACKRE